MATRIQRRRAAAVGLVATLSFSHGVVADVSPALIGFSPHLNTIEKATLTELYGRRAARQKKRAGGRLDLASPRFCNAALYLPAIVIE